jgi:hypothetical protein
MQAFTPASTPSRSISTLPRLGLLDRCTADLSKQRPISTGSGTHVKAPLSLVVLCTAQPHSLHTGTRDQQALASATTPMRTQIVHTIIWRSKRGLKCIAILHTSRPSRIRGRYRTVPKMSAAIISTRSAGGGALTVALNVGRTVIVHKHGVRVAIAPASARPVLGTRRRHPATRCLSNLH